MTKFGRNAWPSEPLSVRYQQVNFPLILATALHLITASPASVGDWSGTARLSARTAVLHGQYAQAFRKIYFSPHDGETSKDVSPLSFLG
jgi:hypothetical protein